jgi:hypothetical protein
MYLKKIVFLLLSVVSVQVFGCHCGIVRLLDYYQGAEFVASAKILAIQPDKQNQDYHDIDIEIIELYKGKSINKLKITSVQNSSCAFYTSPGSTWLIFASKGKDGDLTFGSCSGSLQMDRKFNDPRYPTADRNYSRSVAMKLEALNHIKAYEKIAVNEFDLMVNGSQGCTQSFKGVNLTSRVAVYELKVSANLVVEDVKALQPFDDKNLSKELINCLKQSLRVRAREITKLPKGVSLLLIYYYYPEEGENKGFISDWNL